MARIKTHLGISKIFLRASKTSTASPGGIRSKSSTKNTTFCIGFFGSLIKSLIMSEINAFISAISAIAFS